MTAQRTGRGAVMVLTGNGINCERETAHACRLAGARDVRLVSIWDWSAGRASPGDFGMIVFPGGFLDGDDLGAARACALRIRHTRNPSTGETLAGELLRFVEGGGLLLGICNGFQLLVKLGLLPSWRAGGAPAQTATLTFNDSGRFEDRWVHLAADPASPCVFTRGIGAIDLPVRHGEGKLVLRQDAATLAAGRRLVPLRYADPVSGAPTERYPANPNGSPGGAAALCDLTGRIMGLMPHPECFWSALNHPDWPRRGGADGREGSGLAIFRSAVQYMRDNAHAEV